MSVYVSPPLPGRNAGSRGAAGPGPGMGPMTNFNRSTEDLRVKQQSASYGRLRESMGSQFVVSIYMHGCACVF